MNTVERESVQAASRNHETVAEVRHERWAHMHVNWTAVWIGALASLSVVLLFGLVGIALGFHLFGPDDRLVDLKKLRIGTLIFSVCMRIFFVRDRWLGGRQSCRDIACGTWHAPRCNCLARHGSSSISALGGLGAASFFGSWLAGLGGSPSPTAPVSTPYIRPDQPDTSATESEIAAYRSDLAEYHRNVKRWREETPKVICTSALGAITALLLGLIGGAIGGWMASGEPMNFTHYRTRKPLYHTP